MPSAEQLKEVERQKKINNIPAWHSMGITGKGINVMNLETPNLKERHCESCTERVKHAAPDVTVYETGITFAGKTAMCKYNGKTYDVEDFIREFKIKIIIRSTGGKLVDPEKSEYWNGLKEKYNLVFVAPIGNNKVTCSFPADVAIQVGGVGLSNSGTIKVLSYSGKSEYLELVNFMGYLNGTSFAAPYTAGMIALYLQKFGIDRTQEEAFEYLKAHCKDLAGKGKDNDSGWGIPVMGDPNEEGEIMVSEKTRKEFINKIAPLAQKDMQESQILASLTIAQACLESYYGQSGLTKRANNLFGIKGSYKGKTTIAGTQECYNGQWVTIQAGFRVYPSWDESIADHSALFNNLDRYEKLKGCKDYKLACKYVIETKDGKPYATDPGYTSKLINLIEAYKLYQYDTEVEDLTREETLALIKEVLTGSGSEPSAWAKESWDKAKTDGITDGTNPKGYITREQAITMIERSKGK